MKLNNVEFTRTKLTPNGRWIWKTNPSIAEILAGVFPRKATARRGARS